MSEKERIIILQEIRVQVFQLCICCREVNALVNHEDISYCPRSSHEEENT